MKVQDKAQWSVSGLRGQYVFWVVRLRLYDFSSAQIHLSSFVGFSKPRTTVIDENWEFAIFCTDCRRCLFFVLDTEEKIASHGTIIWILSRLACKPYSSTRTVFHSASQRPDRSIKRALFLWHQYEDCTDRKVCVKKYWHETKRILASHMSIEKEYCFGDMIHVGIMYVWICMNWKTGLGSAKL